MLININLIFSLFSLNMSQISTSPLIFPRILSIQSHIVHGYVGNKAAVFPLQALRFNFYAINTVHLSNHPAYPAGFKGQFLSGEDLRMLADGLKGNSLLNYDMILSGYISKSEVLSNIPNIIKDIKDINPNSIYLCDPVMGDRGQFYVPKELLNIYMNDIIPICDIATPNIFEAEMISGIAPIDTVSKALEACKIFHKLGVKVCLLKGLTLSDSNGQLSMIISSQNDKNIYRIDTPKINGHFSGCGDLCSALMLAWYYKHPNNIALVLDKITGTMSSVISYTVSAGSKELSIVENMDIYENPPIPEIPAYTISGPVTGVIFDMDGTLTECGAIDFTAIRNRIGLIDGPDDIITQIKKLPIEKQSDALNIVIEEEILGCDRMIIRNDTVTVLDKLKLLRIRTAIATRNCEIAVNHFTTRLDIEIKNKLPINSNNFPISSTTTTSTTSTYQSSIFSSIVTRDTLDGINKPDSRVATYILNKWGITDPSTIWFVGDHNDDILCGKNAGCRTCLIVDAHTDRSTINCNPDIIVESLSEFLHHIIN